MCCCFGFVVLWWRWCSSPIRRRGFRTSATSVCHRCDVCLREERKVLSSELVKLFGCIRWHVKTNLKRWLGCAVNRQARCRSYDFQSEDGDIVIQAMNSVWDQVMAKANHNIRYEITECAGLMSLDSDSCTRRSGIVAEPARSSSKNNKSSSNSLFVLAPTKAPFSSASSLPHPALIT